MVLEITENFPRGGKKSKAPNKREKHKTKNLFSVLENSKPKKKKQKREKSVVEETVSTVAAEMLTYNRLQEGMLILGCIKNITALAMELELPGRMFGTVHINSISDEFTQFLESILTNDSVNKESDLVNLSTVFRIGQLVPTKVLSVREDETKTKVTLSMKPSVINSDLSYRCIKEGMLMWAVVSSILDHGYQLTNGVKNCRVFLPFNKFDRCRQLVVGEPLWCVVQKCNISSTVSTITVSAIEKEVFSAKESDEISLHSIIPGMQFPLIINQHVKYGIEVNFNDQCTGYINECYFKNALEPASNYQEGKVVLGRVLYIQPTTRLTYFTLRGLEDAIQPQLGTGTIITGQVLLHAGKGVFLKLGKHGKGFVPFKRIMRSITHNPNADISEQIKKKFALGSNHQCRIFDYHSLDNLYFCSVEPNLIKEKFFTISDIEVGQLVKVKVDDIKESGIVVRFGQLKGFVKNLHLSNVMYSNNIKRKFSVGQALEAKIWNIDGNANIYLTLKQALIDSDKCLKSYEDVVVGETYPGIVVKTSRIGVLCIFYADVKGFLPQTLMKDIRAEEAFYIGQVINVTIHKIDNDRITLSLEPPKRKETKEISVGQLVNAVITEIGDDVKVRTNKNVDGVIPATHLTLSQTLAKAFLEKYQVGDSLKHLFCITNYDIPVLSLKESQIRKGYKHVPFKSNDLEIGSILRCFFISKDESGIKVICPFMNNSRRFVIKNEGLLENSNLAKDITFENYQTIIAKIVQINKTKKFYRLSARLSEVFDYDLQYTIKRFQNYLDEINEIREYLKKKDNPLANLNIGQKIKCTIVEVNEEGCTVSLPDELQGVVNISNCHNDKTKKGEIHDGVIVWVDFVNKIAEISLKKNFIKPQSKQKVDMTSLANKIVRVEYISVKHQHAIGIITNGEGKGQIILSPTSLHENDFIPNLTFYKETPCQVFVYGSYGSHLIGLPENYRKELNKRQESVAKKQMHRKGEIEDVKQSFVEKDKRKKSKTKEKEILALSEAEQSVSTEEIQKKESKKSNKPEKLKKREISENEKTQPDTQIKNDESVASSDRKGATLSDYEQSSLEDDETLYTETDDGWLSEPFEIEQPKKQKKIKKKKEESESIKESGKKILNQNELVASKKGRKRTISLESGENSTSDKTETEDTDEGISSSSENITLTENKKKKIKKEKAKNKDFEKNKSEKRKLEIEDDDSKQSKKKLKTDNKSNKVKKSETESKDTKQSKKLKTGKNKPSVDSTKDNSEKEILKLPGVTDFFSQENPMQMDDRESEDDIDELQSQEKKKKRLTAAERKELARQQEEEIRKKELELLEASENPQSADQFDRLLIANPNSSQLWIQYMAYHIGNTQNDRARAIARKALETIDMRESQEKLNVWIALLNLENRFGDRESFEKVFEEAVRCNDSYQVYMETIKMLADSQNFVDMEEKIRKTKGKFKQEPKMWIEIARIYYKCGRFKEARNLKQGALRSVNNKKEHIDLITQFAVMEFNHGEPDQGEALFETVIQSVPQRVDVWCTYVDQLVKQNKIDLARRVLDRSICQKLSSKRIATLFKKYKTFEEKYGTKENLDRLKRLAAEYTPLEK